MAVEKSPIGWALTPLKRYAEFSGRSSRAEFWWFTLAIIVVYFAMSFLLVGSIGGLAPDQAEPSAGMIGAMGAAGIFMILFWLLLLIPTLAVQTRRLHDTNRSGWWLIGFYSLYAVYAAMLFTSIMSAARTDPTTAAEPNMGALGITMVLGLAIFVYGIVLFVFNVLPGTKGDNRYGPDPYGPDVEQVFA